jgi:flagellin-like hook-associated protein FlgL
MGFVESAGGVAMRDYNGLYQAYVESSDDPENKRRITARVPDVLGQTISNWARPASIIDYPMPKDAMVWIAFPNGDIRYPVYHVRNDPAHGRIIPGPSSLSVDGPGGAGVTVDGDVHAKKSTGSYVNVYAVDFLKTSAESGKSNIVPYTANAVTAIKNAPVYTYTYNATGAAGVGPLRANMPAITQAGTDKVSMGSMIGILWAANTQLSNTIDALTTRVADIEDYLFG